MSKTSEELEDEDLYEICRVCGSINIVEYDNGNLYCAGCGAENYTKTITSEEYGKIK